MDENRLEPTSAVERNGSSVAPSKLSLLIDTLNQSTKYSQEMASAAEDEAAHVVSSAAKTTTINRRKPK